jgi:MFS family permease
MSKTARRVGGSLRVMRALVVLLVGQAMASMDASILVVASPSLRANLHTSDPQLQLIVAMYTIAFATLVVTGARVGDVVGRRRAFVVGLTAFTLASLAGGLAPTPDTLTVARALQGGAAAVMTPQVLSIIQLQFEGEMRARAVGAYSMILAVGVAAGQVLGGLLVGTHLLAAAWRPALLLNVPIGALLLLGTRRGLPDAAGGPRRGFDLAGAGVLSVALLALVVPLTFGRDAGWPPWVWPSLGACGLAFGVFVAVERRIAGRGGDPLFDLDLMKLPNIAAGVVAVVLLMACYAGFLVSLTLHLQDGLGFAALHSGLTFACYASGFATVSLTWTRLRASIRHDLSVFGPSLMGSALLAVGLIAAGGGWPVVPTAALLVAAGAGHACGFSPLVSGMAAVVDRTQAADLSGLVITASQVGQVLGVAAFVGIYLAEAARGSAVALEFTTGVLAAALVATSACAWFALKMSALGSSRRLGRPSR